MITQPISGRLPAWKRAFDIFVSAIALLLASPFVAVAAVAIRVWIGSPVIVRVTAVGQGGRPVTVRTLRTLTSIDDDPSGAASRSVASRISRVVAGTRLDRVPALFSVLGGDLSLVGHDWAITRQIDWLDPTYKHVLAARPGVISLSRLDAQPQDTAHKGPEVLAAEQLALDAYYLDHRSLGLDVRVLLDAARSYATSMAVLLAGAVGYRRAPSTGTRLGASVDAALARLRGRQLFLIDLVGSAIAIYVVFVLRFTWDLAPAFLAVYLPAVLTPLFVRPVLNFGVGLYDRMWRHASVPELLVIVRAILAGTVVSVAVFYLVLTPLGIAGTRAFPRSFWILEGLLALALVATPRLAVRASANWRAHEGRGAPPLRLRALLYGAGSAGAMVARSAQRESDAGLEPVGFLDDDPSRKGKQVAGLTVFGDADALRDAVTLTGARVLLITMPRAEGPSVRRVTQAGFDAGLDVRTVPPMHELYDGTVDAYRLRRVRVEDLIRRPETSRIGPEVQAIIRDRCVLVTGAGGSIGSELARQVFAMHPARLVLIDRAESPLYSIERELDALALAGRGGAELQVHLANIASRAQARRLVESAQPDVIIHAAAYKHVPLMESHPSEAVHVNIGGTMAVVDAAVAAGTGTFVLVSTDKAVTPTSTMGATKRVAEWLVAEAAQRTGRGYVSVRFGNVLGSTGSVVPIFQGQLEQGQALTITHPEMTRFFMTIPEASSLILQAAAVGRPGDTLVLDMGNPIKILDLARDLIRLAGRDPDTVPMVFTGIRPGEKLHEELFYKHESAGHTSNPNVWLARGTNPDTDVRALALELLTLADSLHDADLRKRLFEALEVRSPGADTEDTPVAVGVAEPARPLTDVVATRRP